MPCRKKYKKSLIDGLDSDTKELVSGSSGSRLLFISTGFHGNFEKGLIQRGFELNLTGGGETSWFIPKKYSSTSKLKKILIEILFDNVEF